MRGEVLFVLGCFAGLNFGLRPSSKSHWVFGGVAEVKEYARFSEVRRRTVILRTRQPLRRPNERPTYIHNHSLFQS